MGELTDAGTWQESVTHEVPCRRETGCFDEADESPVLAVESDNEGACEGCRVLHAQPSSLHQANRAIQLGLSSVAHVDLDQVGWHGPMVAGSSAPRIAVNTD
jgi:hypothetical protein